MARVALLFLAACIALPLQDKHLLDAIDHLKAELDELSSQAERSTNDKAIIEQNRLHQIAQDEQRAKTKAFIEARWDQGGPPPMLSSRGRTLAKGPSLRHYGDGDLVVIGRACRDNIDDDPEVGAGETSQAVAILSHKTAGGAAVPANLQKSTDVARGFFPDMAPIGGSPENQAKLCHWAAKRIVGFDNPGYVEALAKFVEYTDSADTLETFGRGKPLPGRPAEAVPVVYVAVPPKYILCAGSTSESGLMLRVDAPVRILSVHYGAARSHAKFVPTMKPTMETFEEVSDKEEWSDEEEW